MLPVKLTRRRRTRRRRRIRRSYHTDIHVAGKTYTKKNKKKKKN